MKKKARMRTLKDQQMMSIPGAVLVYFFGFVSLIPLFVMLLGAFKNNIDIIKYPMSLNPFKNPTMKNIVEALTETDMLLWFKNSFISSGVTALATIFMGLAAGYALAKIKFRGKGLLFGLVMATMMMPKQMLLVPNYLVAKQLGLVNTMIGLILTSLAPAFGVFLSRQFIMNLPTELFDAAEVDGCGELRKFFTIVVPLSLPAAGTIGIFSFFSTFNDYIWQTLMITDKALYTLPVGVAVYSSLKTHNVAAQLGAALVSTIPLVIIFFCCQKLFIKGATAGAVKG